MMPGRPGGSGRSGRSGRALLLAAFACALAAWGASRALDAQQPPPKPSFQSSVEVTSLDVSVVDDRGKPLKDLAPADFNVRIDGTPRRVVSAEWIPLTEPAGAPAPPPPDGYTTNESATGGRLIVLAVDQPNIRFGGAAAIARAANGFIDRLSPSDRIAVAGFGVGAPSTPFTADRERVKRAIGRMVGQKQANRSIDSADEHRALRSADDRQGRPRRRSNRVQTRECQATPPIGRRGDGDVPQPGGDAGAHDGAATPTMTPIRRPTRCASCSPACG